ncbi:cadherin-4-like [Stegostoma tigrinum]|uniref:cadherin-4-like n=1 Tax=Stegostoma tigrinum TaxID=3053191 RepID=UPI00202B022D|nr:cadherin-4-like [Stegostoma tigrinum]
MPWITTRNAARFLLVVLFSQTGQCCEKGFSKSRFDSVLPPKVPRRQTILTVKFHSCHLGKHIKLSTDDANFAILSNGSLYATHALNLDSTYHFKVIAKDQKTHKEWKARIRLIPAAKDLTNELNKVMKRKSPVVYFPKHHNSRRQKREWIIPPVAVREHEPPMHNPIAIIRSDLETNEKIHYTISGHGADLPPVNLFVIDRSTGELNITGMVDREINPSFVLTGKAVNTIGREVEKRLSLVIEVLDINDNAPVFTEQVFEGAIEELSPVGTLVLKLNATDADIGENAQVAYRILSQGANEMFLAKSNGEIRTMANSLDREIQDLYTLTVEGRDLNGKASGLFSTANAQIRILDVNDNIPTLEKEEYEVSVEENSLNDEVTRIKVFDNDQEFTDNWLGHFEIIEGNEGGHFRFEVDEQTNEGILVLQKELDYEESQTKNLVLRVCNRAAYHSSVTSGGGVGAVVVGKPIRIKVNVNDKKEGFSFKPTKKRLTISEDRRKVTIGQSFGKYPAISADTGKESERTRYAKNSDPANLLNINPETGEITLNKLPDRESPYVVDGKYTATVLAIDNEGPVPKTATGTVVLDVDDDNDNIPLIRNLQPCMCEQAKSLLVTAHDADSYPNAAPYHYKLVEKPGVTDKWKILMKNDTSAELQPLVELWPHTFKVPIKVEDNQGSGEVQNLDVSVIECSGNDLTCSPEKIPRIGSKKAALGSPAIGLMVLGALMLLLAPLLLLFCNCGGAGGASTHVKDFKRIPIEPLGYLDKTNIEGGGEVNTTSPLLSVDGSGVKASGGMASGGMASGGMASGGMAAGGMASRGMTSGGMKMSTPSEVDGYKGRFSRETKCIVGGSEVISSVVAPGYIERPSMAGTYRPISGAARDRRMSSSHRDYIGSYISEKLNGCAEEDQNRPARDCLLVYTHEGDGSPVGSIDSCSFIEDEPQFKDSYLDDLGPKFKTLADICVSKFESQTSTVSIDAPARERFSRTETSISSSSGGLHGLNIVADPPRMQQKNYVVTTTINPVPEGLPGIVDLPVAHQNVIMTKQVNAKAGGVPAMVIDPSITHQNVVVTKQVNANTGGMPAMVIDPSVAHQSVVMTKQVNANAGGMPGMVIDPTITHQNVIMTKQVNANQGGVPAMVIDPSIAHQNVMLTKSVNVSSGGMQGMVVDPLFSPVPEVHKNVTLSRPISSGARQEQNTMASLSLDQIPIIHKNVSLTRPSQSAVGADSASDFGTFPLVQNSSTTRRSVTSTDGVHKTVTKVTKVTQVMQE